MGVSRGRACDAWPSSVMQGPLGEQDQSITHKAMIQRRSRCACAVARALAPNSTVHSAIDPAPHPTAPVDPHKGGSRGSDGMGDVGIDRGGVWRGGAQAARAWTADDTHTGNAASTAEAKASIRAACCSLPCTRLRSPTPYTSASKKDEQPLCGVCVVRRPMIKRGWWIHVVVVVVGPHGLPSGQRTPQVAHTQTPHVHTHV